MNRLVLLIVTLLVVSCGDDRENEPPVVLQDATLPGVYSGVFPCDGCPGIASTLWLRSDSRFFFEQRYPVDTAREASDAYSLGRWSIIADDRAIELRGAGPKRTFTRLDRDTLVMRTDSDLEHRLTRDLTTTDFSASIRMVGEMRVRGDSAYFTECLTGLVASVNKGGDFRRFRHQYRSAGTRGQPAYVELEGRFSWSRDGVLKSLTIERFITIKAIGTC